MFGTWDLFRPACRQAGIRIIRAIRNFQDMDLLSTGALLIVLILLIPLSWIWPPNSPWAPWWRTSSKIARKGFEMAKVNDKDVVYELSILSE